MKTSIVSVTIKCIVRHEDDERYPEDHMSEANYSLTLKPDHNKSTPEIIATTMVEAENEGECEPDHKFL